MRKFILAIVTLFFPADAHAHVLAVPFPDVGSLQDVREAAFFMPQTYLPPAIPQVTCAMATGVASVGGPCTTPSALGVCNGDAQTITRNITTVTSPSPANKNLFVSAPTFVPGDTGKTVIVPGIGFAGNSFTTTITYVDAQNVTMAGAALTAVTGTPTTFQYGNDDTPVFAQFNVWALANQGSTNQVVQNFAASSSCWFGSQISGGRIKWQAGIRNLVVEGSNSTIDGTTVPWLIGAANVLCQKGLNDASGCSARIKTVSSGSSTIELTAASFSAGYVSRFSVGQWILVAGLNPQEITGGSGFPPNATFFDWRQVTAICNNTGPCSGTATLTLSSSLTYNYLDTWPSYSTGSSGDSDPGGPATIYAMTSDWDTQIEIKNLTMNLVGQMNGSGRSITYRNVNFGFFTTGGVNNCGAFPSLNDTFSAYNTNWGGCTIESDKIAKTVLYDGMSAGRIDVQSASIENMTIQNNSTVSGSMFGTARFNSFSDFTVGGTFRLGSTSYGNSTRTVCVRCNVGTLDASGSLAQTNLTDYSKVGSVLQFLNSAATGSGPPNRIFAPVGVNNSNIFYVVGGSNAGSIGLTVASALTQDATNTYAQTGDTVAFPPPFTSATGTACCQSIRPHPAPQFTCTDPNPASDPQFIAVCTNAGAPALSPIGQYSKRSYTASSGGALGDMIAKGKIVSLTIAVTTAATGTGNARLNPTGAFKNETVAQSTWTPYDWVPTINLKQTGTRVITPSGTTCDGVAGTGPGGSCAGDICTTPAVGCYTLPEAVWIKESIQPTYANVPAGGVNPQFTITIQTDQGVVP